MNEQKKSSHDGPVIVITGGSGFLGSAIVRELLKDDRENGLVPGEIRIFDIRESPRYEDHRVRFIEGDIRNPEALAAASHGADIIFHCAALVDWGQNPRRLLEEINVTGTWNVIGAAAASGARALVYTSSMDVLYAGRPIVNGDETDPYPERYDMAYAETKSRAEQAVLSNNGMARGADLPNLLTCVIRPCGMFGEADPYHVSSFIKMARSGKLTFRIGSGKARFQHVYVGNVAHAHVLAARSLLQPESCAAGRAYFITDFEAKNFFDYMEPILQGIGYAMPPKKRSIPQPVMYAIASVIEAVSWMAIPFFRFTPPMNRTSVTMVCTDMTFSGEKARCDLGYRPVYTEEEAIARTIEYFKKNGPVL